MKTQLELLKEIVTLAEKNPNMEIHFCVDSEEIMDCGWTAHHIQRVAVNPWFEDDERIMIDEDEIKDHFSYAFDDNEDVTEQQIEDMVNAKYEQEVNLAICVFTHP